MTTRTFHLGDVLSITTGLMLSNRGVEAFYDLLNFMTGDNLFTHQLPRAVSECAPEILRQHPDLADVSVPTKFYGDQHVYDWLVEQVATFGEYRDLEPLAAKDHTRIDPLTELRMMRPDLPVIAVAIPEDGGS